MADITYNSVVTMISNEYCGDVASHCGIHDRLSATPTDEKYLSKTLASSKFLDISYTQNYSDRQTETDINLLSVTLHVVLLPPRTAVSWEPQSRTAVVSCM